MSSTQIPFLAFVAVLGAGLVLLGVLHAVRKARGVKGPD